MKTRNLALTLFLLLASSAELLSQVDSSGKNVFKILPAAYYTPETRIAIEGFAFYSFYSKKSVRKSNIRIFITYTQNKQSMLILPWQIYTPGDNYYLSGVVDYRVFPEYFFGLGNNTDAKVKEIYSYASLILHNKSLKKISENTYLGLLSQYQYLNTSIPDNSILFANEINAVGFNGYKYGSSGISLMVDKRNNILCPVSGRFFEFSFLKGIAFADRSRSDFTQFYLDFRDYFRISKKIILANQIVTQLSYGNLPYRVLPMLGGPYLHRGYYLGRFRDNCLYLYQSEFRRDIAGRFGMVIFASAGRVFSEFNKWIFSNIHPAGGLGVRFRVSKNDHANIRVDYGITPDSRGLYVYFAEAF